MILVLFRLVCFETLRRLLPDCAGISQLMCDTGQPTDVRQARTVYSLPNETGILGDPRRRYTVHACRARTATSVACWTSASNSSNARPVTASTIPCIGAPGASLLATGPTTS